MAFANELFGSTDGILFGRKTYEGFVSYWDALDPADASIRKADVEFARIFGNTLSNAPPMRISIGNFSCSYS
jgi:dihydrofolate reductase